MKYAALLLLVLVCSSVRLDATVATMSNGVTVYYYGTGVRVGANTDGSLPADGNYMDFFAYYGQHVVNYQLVDGNTKITGGCWINMDLDDPFSYGSGTNSYTVYMRDSNSNQWLQYTQSTGSPPGSIDNTFRNAIATIKTGWEAWRHQSSPAAGYSEEHLYMYFINWTFTNPPSPVGTGGSFGAPGSPGSTGATGAPGAKGDKGDAGPKGDTGSAGATGPAGVQGDPGPKGDTGSRGADGSPGAQGEQGLQGDVGPAGPRGPAGAAGAAGADGAAGAAGAKGDKGDKGDTGVSGSKGDKGDTGSAGAAGAAGPKGDQGEQGFRGLTGERGLQGDPGATTDLAGVEAKLDQIETTLTQEPTTDGLPTASADPIAEGVLATDSSKSLATDGLDHTISDGLVATAHASAGAPADIHVSLSPVWSSAFGSEAPSFSFSFGQESASPMVSIVRAIFLLMTYIAFVYASYQLLIKAL